MIKVLTLPIPNKVLSPNARPNRFAKSRAVKAHRDAARREAYLMMRDWDFPTGFVVVSLTYRAYWKHRGRDDVNLLASCKAYEDGIQDALRQDDSTWSLEKPIHLKDADNPRLEILINIEAL